MNSEKGELEDSAFGWCKVCLDSGEVAIAKREDGVPSNYRPIACLPLWKLLTGILPEKLYGHFQGNRLLFSG